MASLERDCMRERNKGGEIKVYVCVCVEGGHRVLEERGMREEWDDFF